MCQEGLKNYSDIFQTFTWNLETYYVTACTIYTGIVDN